MSAQATTELQDLLQHDVQRGLFHLVLSHLEARDGAADQGRLTVQAGQATVVALRHLGGERSAQLAQRFGCSEETIRRRSRLVADALRTAGVV